MTEKIIEVKYSQYESLTELSNDDAFLVAKAREASLNAWAPYSNFRVGAAVQLDNGEIVSGNDRKMQHIRQDFVPKGLLSFMLMRNIQILRF